MSELSSAIKAICEEKNLSYEAVIATIEQALAAAYRKDFGQKNQNIKVEFDPETGKSKVYDIKTVVEDMPEIEEIEGEEGEEDREVEEGKKGKAKKEIKEEKTKDEDTGEELLKKMEERKFNPKTEIEISEAKLIKKTAKLGDEIKTKLEVPDAYGRMAAQTAKQVIIQRLREAEREMIFSEFKGKEKEVVSGVVQRREGRLVLIDLGKTVGFLPAEEQIFGEKYNPGERIKAYIKEVRLGSKGAEVILSRTSDEILKKIFYLEIPEISNGLVELKAVAREAGSRSKVAVWTDSENVDPIGSCVGQRGARIQTIINELGGEKVDIILYNEDPAAFIANALSPAKILNININEKERKAEVKVIPEQLSLAIGKNGQNARLAARLTGWRIDIVGEKSTPTDAKDVKEAPKTPDTPKNAKEKPKEDEVKKEKDEKGEKAGEGEEGKKDEKAEKPKKKTEDRKKEKGKGKTKEKAEKKIEKKDDKEEKNEKEKTEEQKNENEKK
ncbi:MAG: transcription termination factor NusA [Candidatus Falkowbacteria bacterium]